MMIKVLKKLIYGERVDSEHYVKYLKKGGMKIGDNVFIVNPKDTEVDNTRPWLIEIGDNVTIASGVTILTHGYDWSVVMNKYNGEMYASSGKVKIGNNVFIGVKSTILKGVKIGDNVIIGANSLVNKDIPNDVVVAGNPAKIIMSLEEYRLKRKANYVEEAKILACEYYKTYNKKPTMDVFKEYFMIMSPRTKEYMVSPFLKRKNVNSLFYSTEPQYEDLDIFLKECGIK